MITYFLQNESNSQNQNENKHRFIKENKKANKIMGYKTEQKEKLITYMKSHTTEQLPMKTIVADMIAQGVGESTVYRLLKELVESGEVRRFVCSHNRRFFYQANTDQTCGHHMHLKCLACGRMVHLNAFVSDFMCKQVLAANRFAIDEHMTLLYGYCVSCKERTSHD